MKPDLSAYGHFEDEWFVLAAPLTVKNADGGEPLRIERLNTSKMVLPPGFTAEDLLYILLSDEIK